MTRKTAQTVDLAADPRLAEALGRLMAVDSTDFGTLARAAGLDPATDFRGADLSGLDFGTSDLSAIDVEGCDLLGADFSRVSGQPQSMERARLKSGQIPHICLSGHRASVNSVAFSPDGTRLVSGSWDRTLRLWDLSKRPASPSITDPAPSSLTA